MELIGKQIAIETILGQPPELHYPSWYAAQIEKLPPAPPEYLAEQAGILVTDSDTISRQGAIELVKDVCDAIMSGCESWYDPETEDEVYTDIREVDAILKCNKEVRIALRNMSSAQPEIIRCKDCIYYDPPHVENNGVRYEYDEMPADAFDALGTGLVNAEYGINIGGRCCVDYYCKNYSDDKRVFVREDNYCGRAERRTDE